MQRNPEEKSPADAMDEVEPARHEGRAEEASVVDALARFLLSFDLPEEEQMPPGAEPIVPLALRERLLRALEEVTNAAGRASVRHGRLRVALESCTDGEQRIVMAGVLRESSSRGPQTQRKERPLRWPEVPVAAEPLLARRDSADSFQQHFRGLRGEFYAMRPRDLIQFFCSCGTTVEVRFQTNLAERGEVLIEQGNVLHCATGELVGDDAARVMMLWESGDFLTRPLRESPPSTVTLPWMTLMLEHAREIDESGEFATVSAEIRPETLEALPDWMDTETPDDTDPLGS
ncbi:MAG: DUF4388 domain-containing protein [Planctomycetes bacterium]|nr:DUF4388 domain-containing protein [Planctomycetota bacterium]